MTQCLGRRVDNAVLHHLLQGHVQGGVADSAVVAAQHRFIAFNLVPHIGKAALQLQYIGQFCRLGENRQKSFLLQPQRIQPRLGVGIAFGHIGYIGAAAYHIAQPACRAHCLLQLFRRYSCGNAGITGIVAAAVQAAALLGTAFDISAAICYHLLQSCQRLGIFAAFQFHLRRLDQLPIAGKRCRTTFCLFARFRIRHHSTAHILLVRGVAFIFHVIKAVIAGFSDAVGGCIAAAAARQQQRQCQHRTRRR